MGFPGSSVVKIPLANAGDAGDTGWEDALEEGMATHSSILAWEIPWTEVHGGVQSMGSQRVRLSDWARAHTHTHTPSKASFTKLSSGLETVELQTSFIWDITRQLISLSPLWYNICHILKASLNKQKITL